MAWLDKEGLTHFWAKIKTALSGKQDKLSGIAGEIVGFDANGNAVAQPGLTMIPTGGNTQAIFSTIPKGRMLGDIDGDGRITGADVNIAMKASTGKVVLDTIEKWAADIDGDGKVTASDILKFQSYLSGSVTFNLVDHYGNWIYDSDTKRFSYSISSERFSTTSSAVVFIEGSYDKDAFTAAEFGEGELRIYTRSLPPEDVSCVILLSDGNGKAIVQVRDRISGPLAETVTIHLDDWETDDEVTYDVQIKSGLIISRDTQYVTVVPTTPANATAYHNAGIWIRSYNAGTLTLRADSMPSRNIDVKVIVTDIN